MRTHTLRPLTLLVLIAAAAPAAAESYPTRTVTIVVPFPAGAATDVVARVVGGRLGQSSESHSPLKTVRAPTVRLFLPPLQRRSQMATRPSWAALTRTP